MSSQILRTAEIEPKSSPARRSVIWLHGLGADGHDFEPIIPHLGVDPALAIRFVFPHAPAIPVTLNGGMVMPAWYDITEMDLERKHDEVGIRRSRQQLTELIAREIERGIPASRIVVAGFSQGGAVALYTGLRYGERLAGLLALSTYMVCADELADERSQANAGISIFQAHGNFDPMVAFDRGEAARDQLLALGYPVEWHSYPMQHEVAFEEIEAIGKWLNKRFAEAG